MQLRPGARVDRYTLVEPLGRGGQGTVWKVVDPIEGAVLSLKLIFLQDLDVAAAERARREARAVAGALFPALIPCHRLFEEPASGMIGLVFDFVSGQPLADVAADPRMSPEHRRAVLFQTAAALARVHALGLVHRDLKPDNLMITDTFWDAPNAPGGVKLIDFGIAAQAGNPRPLTKLGAVIGTVAYMAPELLGRARWAAPDGFARDLFAFGVLAWELCTGAHPTGLPLDASLEAFRDAYREAEEGRRPWPPAGLDGALGDAIRACLAIDAARRPPDGAALASLLGAPHVSPVAPGTMASIVDRTRPYDARPDDRRSSPGVDRTAPHTAPSHYEDRRSYPVDRTAPHTAPSHYEDRRSYPVDRTAPHTAPSRHEDRRSSPAVLPGAPRSSDNPRTTPMPAPPSGALRPSAVTPPPVPPVIPLYEPPPAQPPGAAPSGRSLSVLVAGLVLGALLTAGAALLFSRSTEEEPDPLEISATPGPAEVPVQRDPVVAPPSDVPVPCCDDRGPCVTGRACKPAPCTDTVVPERTWWLRLTGAAARPEGYSKLAFPENLALTHPQADICVWPPAAPERQVCAPLRQVALDGGDRVNRLQISTADLAQGNLEASIVEYGNVLARGQISPNIAGFKTSALCIGLFLYLGPKNSARVRLAAAIDDR